MKDEAYRRRFRRDYDARFTPRVWHRDFHDAQIVGCPDASVVGKSFGEVADARGQHSVDAFLDLVVAHGRKLRWHTTIANDRPDEMVRLVTEPSALIGFADSGAHIRNMAFYSFPLRMLRFVRDRARAGKPVMPIEKAVWRLSGEIADWLGVDAGHLRAGDRADLVVIDPEALDGRLDVVPRGQDGGLRRSGAHGEPQRRSGTGRIRQRARRVRGRRGGAGLRPRARPRHVPPGGRGFRVLTNVG
jgi:N-acyl-D-aspartate/D-glutamate deacylase